MTGCRDRSWRLSGAAPGTDGCDDAAQAFDRSGEVDQDAAYLFELAVDLGVGDRGIPAHAVDCLHGLAGSGGPELVDGQLRGRFATALRAVIEMPPAPQQAGAFGVEQDHE